MSVAPVSMGSSMTLTQWCMIGLTYLPMNEISCLYNLLKMNQNNHLVGGLYTELPIMNHSRYRMMFT